MNKRIRFATAPVAIAGGVWLSATPALAQQALGSYGGDLIVSSSTYTDSAFGVGTPLPYNASGTLTGGSTLSTSAASAFCANANCSSNVWNNDTADANFGITSGIYLQDVNTTTGNVDNTVNVTQLATAAGINLATSFSSKSELAINLSPDGSSLTFMGYNSTVGQFDVSNSNTPGSVEPGNTDIQTATYRAVGQISLSSNALQVTTTNAYNGNNGRAAIATAGGYYLVGNAGNGNGSAQTTANTGVQFLSAAATNGGLGTNSPVGQYSITQQGYAADKTAKDNNFRGETVFNNTLYVSKGSGSNGIDTVYQVGTTGSLPASGPSTPITILPGFNTQLAKTDTDTPHPFGVWFANASTLYVADEGSGASTDFGTSPTTQAGGLEKYSLVGGVWQLDYELKGSLIGSSYTVNGSGAVCGGLSSCGLTTTTDGLRNLTGQVNANGTVTLYAVTSTEGSNLGDAGADPNQIVAITDTLADTTAGQAAGENYTVLDTAALGQVYRGVAVAPVPLPASAWLMLSALGGLGLIGRRKTRALELEGSFMNYLQNSTRLAIAAIAFAAATSAHADTIADWNFGSLAVVAPDNTPAATGGTQAANAATKAADVGMTNSYAEAGYSSSVSYDDIANDTNSTIGNGDSWRIRGSSSATKSTGANGWSINAPEYAQGAQFATTTAGEQNIVLSFNWAASAQGIANMQVQYNTNVNNAGGWTNVGSLLAATVGNSSPGGSYQTDTINFGALGITSVNNDATFGVRLVAAYNPTLGNYASASSVIAGSPALYNNSSGNWRFADVQIDGTAIAPVPLPASVWLLVSSLGGLGLLARRRRKP